MDARQRLLISFLILSLMILSSITDIAAQKENNKTTGKSFKKNEKFIIVVVPDKAVFELRRSYWALADYLSRKLELNVQIKILSDYGKVCDAFLEGRADAAFLGSLSYVIIHAKLGVLPLVRPLSEGGFNSHAGCVFARKDSGIKTASDLKGKVLSLVDKATTEGFIFPLYYLKQNGIEDPAEIFSDIYFAGNDYFSCWAVYSGEADIGAADKHAFDMLATVYPEFKEQMFILSESYSFPSQGLAVRPDLNPALKEQIKILLLEIDKTKEGKKILQQLEAVRFIETKDEDYKPVYQILKEMNFDPAVYIYTY